MLGEWLSSGWSIVLVVFGLGLIIFLHELGHFLMAKKNKVKVEIFSLGFALGIPQLILWRRKWGDTEYRICAVPFGGYVKMAGETLLEDQKGEPWELTSKSPWQRFQIFVAGALMNLIIAFPIGIGAYLVGKYESTNEVGKPGTAETRAGMLPGDVVVEVDGRRIDSLDKYRIEMIRRPTGVRVPVTVMRDGERKTLEVETMSSPYHAADSMALALPPPEPGSPLEQAGVRERDEIVAIDGKRVTSRAQADEMLRARGGKKVSIRFQRRDPALQDPPPFEREFDLPIKKWWVVPADDRLAEPLVGSVMPGTPGYTVFEPGDRILEIDGRTIRSWRDLREMVEPAVNRKLTGKLERQGKTIPFEVWPTMGDSGKGLLGIGQKESNKFADVDPESIFGKAGVRTGDLIVSTLQGKSGEGVTIGNSGILSVRRTEDAPVTFEIVRGTQREHHKITIQPIAQEEADLAQVGFRVDRGRLVTGASQPYRRRSFGEAVKAGLYEPVDVTVVTIDVLKKLIRLQESPKGLSGPFGIIHASYLFAQKSFGNFLWLLCLITVNLGIFNLLPIPILDGGHNVLLLIEVIRKKFGKPPPSPSFVAAFQWTGLIFVLALFMFVTFNDFRRFMGG